MRLLSSLLLMITLIGIVLADTEIINFQLPLPLSSPTEVPSLNQLQYTTLNPSESIITTLNTSSSSRTFFLNLNDDYSKWTIRVSWPGSSPTKIKISEPNSNSQITISSQSLSPKMNHTKLRQFLNRHISFNKTYSISNFEMKNDNDYFNTSIEIILEPLIIGLIPQTTLPTIGLILISIIIVSFIIPHFIHFIEEIINDIPQSQKGTFDDKKII
ncbi:uncharacterized protein I206_107791 [Kwoniella pini CBS 10737]|uniref:Uncharacterized protein n=1 Tax=Kwoniella pini CBS 10737 TaxID=1296096 RepID=A0A1B9HYA7_9TREE|nr:uncharacterized protein I206_06124 [Kwoniella pini CBS 10737]OCF48256.1 hypothetical protein I206_06124 [Kwoniella pini CBS 10737]